MTASTKCEVCNVLPRTWNTSMGAADICPDCNGTGKQPAFTNIDKLGRGDHNPPIGALAEAIDRLQGKHPASGEQTEKVKRYRLNYRIGVFTDQGPGVAYPADTSEPMVKASDYDLLRARCFDFEAMAERGSRICAGMQTERDAARTEIARLTKLWNNEHELHKQNVNGCQAQLASQANTIRELGEGVAAMQAVVNAASILEQAVNSETQGSEEHYDAQLALCDAVTKYRAALSAIPVDAARQGQS